MSIERELGQLSEAVASLKNGQEEANENFRRFEAKFDKHLDNYSSLKYDVGKVAGSIAIIVTIFVVGVKEALARTFNGH
jgi:hypothetical protein